MSALGKPPSGPRVTIRTSLSKTALWGVILLIDLQTAGKDRFYTAEDVERIVREIIEENSTGMLDALIQRGFDDMIKNTKAQAEEKLNEIVLAGKSKPWTIIQDYEVLKGASEKLKEAYLELEHDLDQRKDLDVFGIGKRAAQVKEAASKLVVKAEKETNMIYAMTSLGTTSTRRSSTVKAVIPEEAPVVVVPEEPEPEPEPPKASESKSGGHARKTSIVSSEDEVDVKDIVAPAAPAEAAVPAEVVVTKEQKMAASIFIRQVGIASALAMAQTGDFSALEDFFEMATRKVEKRGGALLLIEEDIYPQAIENCRKRVCAAMAKKRRSIFGSITKKPTSRAPVIEFCEENEKRTEEILSILNTIDNELDELRRTASKDSSREVVLMMAAMSGENRNLAAGANKYLGYLRSSTKV